VPDYNSRMNSFRALRIFNDDGRIYSKVVEWTLDELSAGDVVIKAAYSSVNYKDALAATGAGKILKRFPLIGGIDVSGAVVSSSDARFAAGDDVLVTGYDLGVGQDGGFGGVVRVPADWVVRLPAGLALRDAMVYGTAGFTAALSVVRLERNGLRAGGGPVAVTGATGGVGSLAVGILSALGHEVTAITGKDDAHDYLRGLGAAHIQPRGALELGTRPLEKATWAGAVDAVGGDLLAWLVRTTVPWGGVASTGLTGGTNLSLTVMPFILRAVSLIGVDSVGCPAELRRETWQRLATDMRPRALASVAPSDIALDDLPAAFDTLLKGQARGRFVVKH
jgi:acrylyl-CoA reductase (NADPH)